MRMTVITETINRNRRRFLGTAAMTIAAAQFALSGSADAQSGKAKSADLPRIKPGTHTSFASLKQIDAGVLNVGYAEAGPADGPPVILLHGWPYDIHSFVDVAPLLASAGYRVIVPYLRGYGSTRFLSNETFRNGQPSALAIRRHRLDGCPQDREGDHRRIRLGRRGRRHCRCTVAGALQGARLGERLSDRQPGSRQDAVAAKG